MWPLPTRDTAFDDFRNDNVCACAVRCSDFTSGRKSVTGNVFYDIDFLSNGEILAVRRCFSSILAIFSLRMRSFDYISTSGLKSNVM